MSNVVNLARLNMSSHRTGWEIKEGDNTLRVERRDLKGKLYVQETQQVVVRQERDKVLLFVGGLTGQCVTLTTPRATELAMALIKEGGLATDGEVVALVINRVDLELPAALVIQIGGALVRKADKADDYQRSHSH
jgi:hypothetical protein